MHESADVRLSFDPASTVVLGIDPSIANTGYGVLRGGRLIGAGKIETQASEPEPLRVWVLFLEVLNIIREFSVDQVALEEFTAFYRSRRRQAELANMSPRETIEQVLNGPPKRRGRHDRSDNNPRSIYLMKAAQTAIQMAALTTGTPLFLYRVADWKGGSRVSKETVIERAQLLYKVNTRDDNITDAIMIGHHHVHHGRFRTERAVLAPESERLEALTVWYEALTVD